MKTVILSYSKRKFPAAMFNGRETTPESIKTVTRVAVYDSNGELQYLTETMYDLDNDKRARSGFNHLYHIDMNRAIVFGHKSDCAYPPLLTKLTTEDVL